MNKPCQAIATAKHRPKYLRLRSNHIGSGPGKRICSEDIATTRNIKGTAKRTEYPIIDDTPGPVDKSTPIISTTMTMDIGIAMSQNKLQALIALVFRTVFRLMLI